MFILRAHIYLCIVMKIASRMNESHFEVFSAMSLQIEHIKSLLIAIFHGSLNWCISAFIKEEEIVMNYDMACSVINRLLYNLYPTAIIATFVPHEDSQDL